MMSNQSTDGAALKPLDQTELDAVLDQHLTWLDSCGTQGQRCDLSGRNLVGLSFRTRSLKDAILRGANLSGADLADVDLVGADMRHAVLHGTDLSYVKGLLPEQLGGTDLHHATFKDDKTFDALNGLVEMAKSNGKYSLALVLGCIYTLLTILTTTDFSLLTNSGTSTVPFVSTPLPLVSFFLVVPLVLAFGYAYFHVHMQRQWEAMGKLPAFFPDGQTLDQKITNPWLLNGFAVFHLPRMKGTPFSHRLLERLLCWGLAWGIVPATLVLIWARYLPRRDWGGTCIQFALLAMTVGMGVFFHRLAITAMREGIQYNDAGRKRRLRWSAVWFLVTILGFSWLSNGAINGIGYGQHPDPTTSGWTKNAQTAVPWLFSFGNTLDWGAFPNLRGDRQTAIPPNWTGTSKPTSTQGAVLQDMDLRSMNANLSFLPNAHFEEARLQHANFVFAVLRGAFFNVSEPFPYPVRLDGANLSGAYLEKAHFAAACLDSAKLISAHLQGVDFTGASLKGADLTGTSLKDVVLDHADLRGANLSGVNLGGVTAKGLSLRGTRFGLGSGQNPNEIFFFEADLSQADLRGANFSGVSFNSTRFLHVNGTTTSDHRC